MLEVDHITLRKVIKKCYQTKRSLYIWGTFGIGKSESVRQASQEIANGKGLEYSEDIIKDINNEKKFILIDIRLSQYDPSDIKGLPFLKGNKTVWALPSLLPTCGHGIIFLDELNLAPPSVQSSAYSLILDRRVGEYVVPDGFSIICAGNESSESISVFELSNPLKNRFVHCKLKVPSVKDWVNWALENGVDGRIITFLEWSQKNLYRIDENDMTLATPRSWKFCSDLIKEEQDIDTIFYLSSTAVGEGIATEFVSFLKLSNVIDIGELMENPSLIRDVDDISTLYSIIGTLTEIYRSLKDKTNMLGVIFKIVENMPTEFGYTLLRFVRKIDDDIFLDIIKKDPTGRVLLAKYSKYIINEGEML